MSSASKFRFTPKGVQALQLPPGKVQHDVWDDLLTGFGLRLSAGRITKVEGNEKATSTREPTKTWQTLRSIKRDGKWTVLRTSLGRYPVLGLADARELARKTLADIDKGVDVRRSAREGEDQQLRQAATVAAAKRGASTFCKVREDFLASKAKSLAAKTTTEYTRVLRNDFAQWDDRALSEITRADLRAVLEHIEEGKSTIAANKAFTFVRAMMNWAVKKDRITAAVTDRFEEPAKAKARTRVLYGDELRIVWMSADALGPVFGPLVKMLALTGQRRDEVGSLRWAEVVDLDGAAPHIHLDGARTKNGLAHDVPLSPSAVTILHAARARQKAMDREKCEWVFTTNHEAPVSGYSKMKTALDVAIAATLESERTAAATAEDTATIGRLKQAFATPWRFHDLRRTLVTGMNNAKVLPHVVEAVVNHISGAAKAGVAGVYNLATYDSEKRVALDLWARHVMGLVNPAHPTLNVLPFAKTGS